MGINNYQTKNPGDVISSDDPNQYKTGLIVDVVPRNSSGVPTDQSGSLGTSALSWLSSFIRKMYTGDPNNNHTITSDSNGILLNPSDVNSFRISKDGTVTTPIELKNSANTLKVKVNGSDAFGYNSTTGLNLPKLRSQLLISSSGTWDVPAGLVGQTIFVFGSGGGGGGGARNNIDSRGGTGGCGSIPFLIPVFIGNAVVASYTVGEGGAGGLGPNGIGGTGQNSTFTINGITYRFGGATGGGVTGNTVVPALSILSGSVTSGGIGGVLNDSGVNGTSNTKYSGGGGGTGGASGGAGGGGGAGGRGVGANGGAHNSGSTPAPDAASYTGAGGGGAGGGSSTNGGNGGSGFIEIYWLDSKDLS